MSNDTYPKSVADVIETLADICRHQKRGELVELLQNARAYFEQTNYDNWNGGTRSWALRLEVPTYLFASVSDRLSEVEQELGQRLNYLDRLHPNDPLGEVSVTPLSSAEIALGQRLSPSDADVRRLWRGGYFRLFLSHVSPHKAQVAELKGSLLDRGISAFVAHEDIEPSLEWQNEISLALRSMDGLVALLTPDFHSSYWTDQEIGWALGRGIAVMPVQLGTTPYGFAGKVQAIKGSLDSPVVLANSIAGALLRNIQTHAQMRRALVEAFEQSDCFATAQRLKDSILTVDDFAEEEIARLRSACRQNSQVKGARGVVDAIYNSFGPPPALEAAGDTDIPC